VAGSVFGLIAVAVGWLWAYPIQTGSLASHARPANTFQESLERIDRLRGEDPKGLHPDGHLILMDHGRQVERAIVFFHGFTNSPRQFRAFGEEFHRLGYNVLIPRMPYHGLQDPLSSNLDKLRAEDLVSVGDEAVGIAQGLGEHVTVAGLSMGGVLAGWVAQFHADVDRAVLIAPNFGTYRVPNWLLKPTINFLLFRPSRMVWWDAQKKEMLPRPPAAYYGFPSRSLGEVRRLGWMVQTSAKTSPPAAGSILIITNGSDRAVSQEGIDVIVRNWKRHQADKIQTYEFPAHLALGHDVIDPRQTDQNIGLVYPTLISLIAKGPANSDRCQAPR
jgi:esterase/lipase